MNAMVPPSNPATAALQDEILAGTPFILLSPDQVPPGPGAAAVLDAAATALAGQGVVFISIANPLAAPLSLGRVMLQIAGTDDVDNDDDAVRVMRALAGRGRGASHLVITVSDADALAPTALSFLQLLPTTREPGSHQPAPQAGHPSPQIVFAGGAGFQALLSDRRFQTIRDALAARSRPVAEQPQHPAEPLVPAAAARKPRILLRALQAVGAIAIALVLLALGAAFIHRAPTTARQDAPSRPVPAALPPSSPGPPPAPPASPTPAPPVDPMPVAPVAPPAAEPSPAPPDSAPPQPTASPIAMPAPTGEPAAERARLRREFDAFLDARAPASRSTTPAERDRLFGEYLARRQGPPPTPAATAPIVRIRYLATSPSAEAAAHRLATALGSRVNGTDLQSAPTVPPIPTIRYFHPPDRPAALALAAATPVPGGEWQVEDATSAPNRPVPGTMELWLPAS